MTNELIKGFEDFRRYQYEGDAALMPQLVEEGQNPDYFIISCIDSRANPGTIFRARPGCFFAHKAMGAIVRPYKKGTALSAGLKFAIDHMQVKKIIIMGHTQCGAIKALIDNIPDEEISEFVGVAQKGLEKAKACNCTASDLYAKTEKEIVLQSMENLLTYPHVKKALEEKRILLKGWLFDMGAGDILEYDVDKEDFVVITKHDNPEDSRKNAG
jgi:carbonic anhydrase